MANEYKAYLLAQIKKANSEWEKAMAEGRYDDAFVYGKSASDLEQIYYYHETH